MKALLFLIVGFVIGLFVDRYCFSDRLHSYPAGTFSSDSFNEKMSRWHLSSDDIRQDLSKTGEVVRAQAEVVGDKIADGRIVTVIKAKYVLDRELTASDLHVSCTDGQVTLTGMAPSPELIGRAVALALDTQGVTGVHSRIVVAVH